MGEPVYPIRTTLVDLCGGAGSFAIMDDGQFICRNVSKAVFDFEN